MRPSRGVRPPSSLETRAGSPPSSVKLLVRYQRIERMDQLDELWPVCEAWFIDIGESHTSLSPLTYYRSPQPDRSWVTAAGAILDTAALAASTLDRPRDSQAELFPRTGYLALRRIADLFAIPYNDHPKADDPISIRREEYDAVCDRLAGRVSHSSPTATRAGAASRAGALTTTPSWSPSPCW